MDKSACSVAALLRVISMIGIVQLTAGCAALGAGSVFELNSSVAADSEGGVATTVRRHLYAGIGVGSSRLEPDNSDLAIIDIENRRDSGAQVTLGVDLSRQLAFEVHAAELGDANFSGVGNLPSGTVGYQTVGTSALAYVGKNRNNYRRKGWSGYGRLGYGVIINSANGNVPNTDFNATSVLFGGGLEYMTRSGFGYRAEAISYDSDVNYTQVAVVYRTGRREKRRNIEVVEEGGSTQSTDPVVAAASPELEACKLPADPSRVTFLSNSEQLTNAARQTLDNLVIELTECRTQLLRVNAHTDNRGGEARNQALSERRAQTVMEYLIDKGVRSNRLNMHAYGEFQPIASNSTPEGRKVNRRVELLFESHRP